MGKVKNVWKVSENETTSRCEVEINNCVYAVDDEVACMAHSVLLLVDALNSKNFKIEMD